MTGEVMDRCPTGIIGFDKMCQGGFIRNSDNLIVGGPGSGKSTFLLQFLWNGATKFGENGLYCSFEPDIVETLSDAMSYGWDFSKLSSEGRMKFMRFSPQTSIEELKSELTKIISHNSIKRVCFDPISVLALNVSEQGKVRQTIFELSALMKRLRVTSVLADETLEGDGMQPSVEGEWTKTDILRFLSDSVTIFYESGIAGVGDRAVRIAKMRRTSHIRKATGMRITGKGVEVVEPNPPAVVKRVEVPVISAPVQTQPQAPMVNTPTPVVTQMKPSAPMMPSQLPPLAPMQNQQSNQMQNQTQQNPAMFSPSSNIPPRPRSDTVIKSTRFV